MKTIGARIGVILAMILLGIFLFISGKEHEVFIENKGEKYTPKNAYYILDGEKEIKIKKKKKKREYIKGVNHTIEVRFKDAGGVEKKVVKEFKTKMGQIITINAAMIESDSWLKIEELKSKK
ncbi:MULTISPECIES: DUF6672 family protein [Psychrilyobacter]|uniref:YxeA family protein n=1 Tax=Psychrilyobacter piezotolerans TaxID=2293438 RepID=A0ABX9KH34_9FUSO|nr:MULTISPECIES: DUF6672 family protein [Psychrilyobacter]MCS5421174.1 hypothetical protein [Psychrilyobacter sp. S5]NDI77911.1 hypothetical protein [Psychrilyobacter piezotolerans]RDE62028.1 hypothetical protein DV867_07535 [Psychrilyobacter sp. S5]REI41275.1 hypothetical protein DYH56_07535 [Psychrilyobacter piezotolerans]